MGVLVVWAWILVGWLEFGVLFENLQEVLLRLVVLGWRLFCIHSLRLALVHCVVVLPVAIFHRFLAVCVWDRSER